MWPSNITSLKFQSTHPARGATANNLTVVKKRLISIHAPREGCDLRLMEYDGLPVLISTHAPREGCDLG